MKSPESSFPYRREVDGLRAFAVLPVIFFHAGFSTFSGGYVGVDVFFVISGYLITSIILAEKEANSFSLARFYERRARRILPALFFVMAASVPFAWYLLVPGDMKEFARSLVAISLFASNILFWNEGGYFATAAELKPLLHTWSLAVEEQFYLLFPLFIILTWRLGKQRIFLLLAFIGILSLAGAHWCAYHDPRSAFFWLPTRAWELMIGALIAFYLREQTVHGFRFPVRQCASFLGLVAIVFSVFSFDKNTPYPSMFALVPTGGAALILLFATPSTLVGKLLATNVFVGIGLISYSAYLWHQPLIAFARHKSQLEPSEGVRCALVAATFLLAYLSWRFVERPFRRPHFLDRSTLFLLALIGSSLFISFGLRGHFTKGFEASFAQYRLDPEYAGLYSLIREHTGKDIYTRMFDDKNCRFWSRAVDKEFEERFARCHEKYGKGIAVFGDSHALNIYNIVAKMGTASFVIGLAQGGCRPHDARGSCHYDGIKEFIAINAVKLRGVVFHQSGAYFFTDRLGVADSVRAFEHDAPFLFAGENHRLVSQYLNELSGFTKVVWLGPFVEARVNFRDLKGLSKELKILEKSQSQFANLEAELKRLAGSGANKFNYVSLFDMLALPSQFLLVNRCITYNDTDHFSECGEDLIAQKLRADSSEWLP